MIKMPTDSVIEGLTEAIKAMIAVPIILFIFGMLAIGFAAPGLTLLWLFGMIRFQ